MVMSSFGLNLVISVLQLVELHIAHGARPQPGERHPWLHAASPCDAFAWMTRASFAPGSLTVRAIFVAGALRRPMSLALSSSSDGSSAGALMAFASRTVAPIAPPRMTSFSFPLA